ncbi:hypothetical protein PFICI_07118 [Pestalotiopsis fici W106-1]|uniref:laccase n=1 Tax=Pestalotiopsis fici (strain W106-1 / CGMCC3.15140) TaxID=1229662 RepID=W3XAB8_PESFW|nr:uncharacterized protein PFICI_07118 [Pestalotiopsis fici W106-1]ETS82116.1 hypothetical protein PFICI_07118 [Pestalotiopsis fici W106-1]
MRFATVLTNSFALFTAAVLAAPQHDVASRSQDSHQCEFDSKNSPQCWGDWSLSTDWYKEGPNTGVIREYWFNVSQHYAAPDGVQRLVMTINGSVPGPTIYADWGDTIGKPWPNQFIVLHVTNNLITNGTSIHFHGVRQNNTSQDDGVASITQCPTAPGESSTYTWRATQYGTTWYHSHFSLQAWNGVFGGVVIRGPATSSYDEDRGVLFLNDWYHQTVDALWPQASQGGPPAADNGLINGTNVYRKGGKRYQTSVTAGKSYRIRLINGAMNTMFRFSIDGHKLTVIGADLVAIKPYVTDSINVGMGQRYDVIVTANQKPGNYWLRSVPQTACSAANVQTLNIKGIFNYDSVDVKTPKSTTSVSKDDCDDESDLVPYVELDVDQSGVQDVFNFGIDTSSGIFRWTINGSPFQTDWDEPTLQQVIDGSTAYEKSQQVVHLNEVDQWVYFVIESVVGLPHPIHLHGHDFFILAQKASSRWTHRSELNTVNPPRRDVAMLPAGGYLVIAYQADNPGVWLLHCHIGWHTSEGFALQLIERQSEIAATVNAENLNQTCNKWNAFKDKYHIVQDDSGV